MKAGSIGTAGGAISPGQAPILGGALQRPLLLTPQLAAGIAVGGVGAVDELLSKNLLALLVHAVLGAWQLLRQRHGALWDVEQAVPCGYSTKQVRVRPIISAFVETVETRHSDNRKYAACGMTTVGKYSVQAVS